MGRVFPPHPGLIRFIVIALTLLLLIVRRCYYLGAFICGRLDMEIEGEANFPIQVHSIVSYCY